MTTGSLWGDLPAPDTSDSPGRILREQANAIGQATQGALTGKVVIRRDSDSLVTDLILRAPYLNNYEIGVVSVRHGPMMYPATMYDLIGDAGRAGPELAIGDAGPGVVCRDPASYEKALKEILQSPRLRKIIASLLAQSKDSVR